MAERARTVKFARERKEAAIRSAARKILDHLAWHRSEGADALHMGAMIGDADWPDQAADEPTLGQLIDDYIELTGWKE